MNWPLKLTEVPSVNLSSFDFVGGSVNVSAKMSKAYVARPSVVKAILLRLLERTWDACNESVNNRKIKLWETLGDGFMGF